MKPAVLTATLAAMLFLSFCVHADERRSFWDDRGHFAGSASSHGSATSFTERNGHFSGSAIRNSDGTTSFYDRSGHFTGSMSKGK